MNRHYYSNEDLAYLSKFYEIDGADLMAEVFQTTPKAISYMVYKLRRDNRFEYYKSIWEQGDVNSLRRR